MGVGSRYWGTDSSVVHKVWKRGFLPSWREMAMLLPTESAAWKGPIHLRASSLSPQRGEQF